MDNKAEIEEKVNLKAVKAKLVKALEWLTQRVVQYANDVQEQKEYLWEHRGDLDHIEKAVSQESTMQVVRIGENTSVIRTKIQKLIQTPYFGRFDFLPKGRENPLSAHYFQVALKTELL